jgi:hypothetical protein
VAGAIGEPFEMRREAGIGRRSGIDHGRQPGWGGREGGCVLGIGCRWRCHRSGQQNVGLGKILALEQQRLPGQRGKRVGEAIPEIEARGMAPFSMPAPSATGLVAVVSRYGDDLDIRLMEP